MKAQSIKDKIISVRVNGIVGFGQKYGNSFLGQARRGSNFVYAGIYQNRFIKKYQRKGIEITKMKFYRPRNPQTPLQQANRQKLANGTYFHKNLINQGFFEAQKCPKREGKSRSDTIISLFLQQKPANYSVSMYGGVQYGKQFSL